MSNKIAPDIFDLPEVNIFAGYLDQSNEKPLLVNIDGYKGSVLGDVGFDDVVNNTLLFSKIGVFGFPLVEESKYLGFTQP